MVMTRRHLLAGAAAALLSTAAPRQRRAWSRPRSKPPAHWVFIMLDGGIDAIYSTDPKERREVESWVDVPYGPGQIRRVGSIPVGPHLRSLAEVAWRPAIINGIQVRTANHTTGTAQFERLKTGALRRAPTIAEILGERRDDDVPLATVGNEWLDGTYDVLYDQTSSADLDQMAAALRQRASRGRRTSERGRVTAASYTDAADLLSRLSRAPKLQKQPWWRGEVPEENSDGVDPDAISSLMQRTLWLLEHDLSACASPVLGAGQAWDTHNENAARQLAASTISMPLVARFLTELGRRRCRHGLLADVTTVMIGSEIGRFPALNGNLGKDHLPEVPLIFYGAGIDTGSDGALHGRTGKHMQALPVDLATGRDHARGHLLELDDVGTTVLRLGGVEDPRVYGYGGRVLEFLTGGA